MKVSRPSLLSVLSSAGRRALQWRLSLLWLLAQALPLLLISLPLWAALSARLDRSRLARRLVEDFDGSVYIEALLTLWKDFSPASLSGALVLFLLLPWLSGTLLTAAGSAEPLGFRALVRGGGTEYARMARLWLWALVPLGLAGAACGRLFQLASEHAAKLALQAEAERIVLGARILAAALFLLACASLDAARALLALEPTRKSVVLAWSRGSLRLFRSPRPLLSYSILTAVGLSLAALVGYARLCIPAAGALGLGSAFLLGQVLVLTLTWMRFARFFGLVMLVDAPSAAPSRQKDESAFASTAYDPGTDSP